MKNILKKIKILLVFMIVFVSSFQNANSLEIDRSDNNLKLYEVKEKEEVLVENNRIIDFYEETHKEVEILIEEKKQEEERLAEEQRLLEEQKRIEEERMRQYYAYQPVSIESDSELVNFALQFVGNPYLAGGTSLTNGTDCSGFVMSVYANFGISLPRSAVDQAYVGMAVSINDIQPGDIISYGYNGYVGHSAIYAGNGMIVHAATSELGIRVDNMYIMPIITIRRVI